MHLYSKLLSAIPSVEHSFDGPALPEPENLSRLTQVHSALVVRADDEEPARLRHIKADGLLTTESGRPVGVQTADCLPVLFAEKNGLVVAAVHAGWRGLNAGILVRAVEELSAEGVRPRELVVAIGPAIGRCCFEVSPDIVEEFTKSWGELWKDDPRRAWQKGQPPSALPARSQAPIGPNDLWIDLEAIARMQLVEAEVPDAQIEDVGFCTYCGPGEMASFRRATHAGQPSGGRQWSWIRKK